MKVGWDGEMGGMESEGRTGPGSAGTLHLEIKGPFICSAPQSFCDN